MRAIKSGGTGGVGGSCSSCGHEVSNDSKDIIISNSQEQTRGSPSPAVEKIRAGGT